MAINKVIYGGNTLIDITDTTALADKVLDGFYFYGRDGVKTEGTCTYNADTSDATATASEILSGSSAYVNGNKINGAMPNNGSTNVVVSSKSGTTIPLGYSDGSAKAVIDSASAAALIAGNVKSGVQILGITGTYTGEAASATAVNITPMTTSQTILPPTGYDFISQANVAAIPYTETPNTYGTTVTIG